MVDLSDPRAERAWEVAKAAYRLHGMRDRVFGAPLFSDPAWNMLLDLFIAACDQRRMSVSDACGGARCPKATAMRYLQLMVEAGLVLRVPDRDDGRRIHVLLHPNSIQKLLDVLSR